MASKSKASDVVKSPAATLRPPVVVVLGHVDHGKTTLLDVIRKTDVASKEHGGITQSIGAYQVTLGQTKETGSGSKVRDEGTGDEKKITFIDTPGHEAFANMRSRGANVADIAILVVAANDSVMPQTIESIKIIKETNIPYIVAINKIDLPEANFDKVVQDLLRHEVMLENYGGEVPFIKVSAKKGEGIKELLDLIELLAEVKEVGKNVGDSLEAVVIESKLDKNRGALATAIIKSGELNVGDEIFAEGKKEKVRALVDYKGGQVKEVGPGSPVEILGFTHVPVVGGRIVATSNQLDSQGESLRMSPTSVDKRGSALNRSDQEGAQSLSLILKADTVGSLEAVSAQIPTNVNLISSGVGEIAESDVMLAKSTKAIILGFNVKINPTATKLAETEKVLTRTYRIIYELLDELKDAATGMLVPEEVEEILGKGQIIAEFPFEKMRVCGTRVSEGRMARGDLIKIVRSGMVENDGVVTKSKVKSIRVGREETNKVEKGKECGIFLDPQVDFSVGDDIIAYRIL